jgi:hypothetical protein
MLVNGNLDCLVVTGSARREDLSEPLTYAVPSINSSP